MRIRVLVALLILALVSGCSLAKPAESNPGLKLTAQVATGLALASIKDEDRPAAAREVYAVASIINSLAGGDPAAMRKAIADELATWNSPYKPVVQVLANTLILNAGQNPDRIQGLLDVSAGAMEMARLYE